MIENGLTVNSSIDELPDPDVCTAGPGG